MKGCQSLSTTFVALYVIFTEPSSLGSVIRELSGRLVNVPVTLEPVRIVKLCPFTMEFSKPLRKLSCNAPATATAPVAVMLS